MKTSFKKVFAVVLALAMVLSAIPAMADVTAGSITVTGLTSAGDTVKVAPIIVADPTKTTGWDFVSDNIAAAFMAAYDVNDAQEAMGLVIADKESTANGNAEAGTNISSSAFRTALTNAIAKVDSWTTVTSAGTSVEVTANQAGVYAVVATDNNAEATYNNMAAFVNFKDYEDLPTELDDVTVQAKYANNEVVKDAKDEDDQSVTLNGTVDYVIDCTYPDFGDELLNPKFEISDSSAQLDFTDATISLTINNTLVENVLATDEFTSFTVGETTYDAVIAKTETGAFTVYVNVEATYENNAGSEVNVTITAAKVVSLLADGTVKNDATYTTNPDTENSNNTDYVSKSTYISDTFEFVLTKKNTDGEVLNGAIFQVVDGNDTPYKFTGENGVYTLDAEGTVKDLVATNGTITLNGLDADNTYVFVEIQAPAGYQLSDVKYTLPEVTVSEDTVVSKANGVITKTTTATVMVEGVKATPDNMKDVFVNTKLGALPSTGGIGTYVFTMAGTAVMAAAVIFFLNRKETVEA